MRLINVQTYQLKEFSGQEVPPYAILSHTWGDHEVSYADWERYLQRKWPLNPSIGDSRRPNAGLEKIQLACQQCRVDGLAYLWVDTNCINKSSSAELTEAINSMFVWYAEAAVCYAYLVDVEYESEDAYGHGVKPFEALEESRWFTRGWTLQELLAPLDVRFYSRSWKFISNKTDTDLCPLLSKITKISEPFLAGRSFMAATVAEKMSWAAKRETTRAEDMAYCLLGIFNIHMPILYGERGNSFLRLQEEIMKKSTDQSLFFWEMIYEDVAQLRAHKWINFLAPSPRGFADYPYPPTLPWMSEGRQIPRSYSISNSGLHIQLPILYNATWSADIQVDAFAVLEPMEYRSSFDFSPEHKGLFCIPINQMDGEKVFQRSLNWLRPVYLKAKNLKGSPGDTSSSGYSTFRWSNTHITIGPEVTMSWELRHPTTIYPSSNAITELSHHGRLFVMYNNDQWTWIGFNMSRSGSFSSSPASPVMPIEVMSSHERLSAHLLVTFDLEFSDSDSRVLVKPSTRMELRRKTRTNSSLSTSRPRLGSSKLGTKVAQLNKLLTLSPDDASNSELILSWGVISVRLTVVEAIRSFVIAHFIHEEPKLDDGLFEVQGS